ncbi:alpha/beta fold hydrolase [Mycobacterium colombiense]|uniref:alpha/beta fold hydrolase n=1 Tax=Mycobacterium colombiense TaxID=339268 RepID=UPI00355620AF
MTEQSTSRTIRTRSWKIHYNEAGEGHPVVLLHGSGPGATGWSNFAPNIGALAEWFRVLAVDMPGWGESDSVSAQERDHRAALLEFLDAMEIEKAAVVGNSMGAATALSFAAAYPDRVSYMVMMGGVVMAQPMMFAPGGGPSEGLKALFAAYRDPSPESMKRLVNVMTFDPAFGSDELAAARSENALRHPEHLQNFVAGLDAQMVFLKGLNGEPTVQQIAAIATPTLLIHGRDDRVISYENSLRLVSVIPDSRLLLMNRCGHWAQLEHADEFNRIVTQFVSQAERQ